MMTTLDKQFLIKAAALDGELALKGPSINGANSHSKISLDKAQTVSHVEISFKTARNYIKHLSTQFRSMGFKEGDVIYIQAPNLIETPLILLALMDAGLIPALIPNHWRLSELQRAVRNIKPSALLLAATTINDDFYEGLYALAMDEISLRYILRLGPNLPDGFTPLPTIEDYKNAEQLTTDNNPPVLKRTGDHIAALGWAINDDGEAIPVAYTHKQLIANAQWVEDAFSTEAIDNIATLYGPTSLPGLIAMVIWLQKGHTLHLSQDLKTSALTSLFQKEAVNLCFLPSGLQKEMKSATDQPNNLPHFALVANSPMRQQSKTQERNHDDLTRLYNLNGLCLVPSKNNPGEGLLKLGRQQKSSDSDSPINLEARLQGTTQKASEKGPIMKGRLELSGLAVAYTDIDEIRLQSAIDHTVEHWEKTHLTAALTDAGMSAFEITQSDNTIYHGNALLSGDELDRLYQAYPGFVDAAAFSIKDPLMGDRLFAAIIPRPGDALSYEDFKSHLERQQISPAKIPEKLVMVAEIPRTADGFVAREQILAPPSAA